MRERERESLRRRAERERPIRRGFRRPGPPIREVSAAAARMAMLAAPPPSATFGSPAIAVSSLHALAHSDRLRGTKISATLSPEIAVFLQGAADSAGGKRTGRIESQSRSQSQSLRGTPRRSRLPRVSRRRLLRRLRCGIPRRLRRAPRAGEGIPSTLGLALIWHLVSCTLSHASVLASAPFRANLRASMAPC